MAVGISLTGRVAVVAGAGRGIGAAVARRLADAGAAVAVVDSRLDRAEATVEAIRAAGGTGVPILADLLDARSGTRIVAETVRHLGRIDILATVAGGSWAYVPYRRIHEVTDDEWDLVHQLNLTYVFRLARETIRTFLSQGRGGAIVHIGSIAGVLSSPSAAAYGAAKAGIASLTRSVAHEYGADGIRVNCVAPGRIETPATTPAAGERVADFTNSIPMRRTGNAGEVADAVLFLASDLASYITGQTLLVDGGATATPGLLPASGPHTPR
ncbi:SDR family NAD(P)-dependent oxidoreductase [Saccharopolyspora spinosa]|uniref:3-oxoacyl-[acyl-carrier protein] reductase n=1 Tax=Saccharopolyspora spinosa TaxID=60894 RepID=A0A2N3Y1R6_SACSN|nr:glucose 1-dehydrogenase [Saccharopolyspora spinosa]PKW16866.1 3-oxoacyl-[acyl-carrier protein] reductase [Saccharopolyspora spinosa]